MVRRFDLGRRLAALIGVTIVASVAVVSLTSWLLARHQIYAQVDARLAKSAAAVQAQPVMATNSELADAVQALALPAQVLLADGMTHPLTSTQLPVYPGDLQVARGGREQATRSVVVRGQHLRVLTVGYGTGAALQVAEDLDGPDASLHRLAVLLEFVTLFSAVVAAILGSAVARAGLRPLRVLRDAAERVARTGDLTAPLPLRPDGDDDVARLARSFNTMLAALSTSRDRQRRLVADAGHELRTPLTSLRTNLELLAREDPSSGRVLDPEDRARLLSDLTAQTEELTSLVGDLTALARDEPGSAVEEPSDVDLAEVTERALVRVRRRAPQVILRTDLRPHPVRGRPAQLERAVLNLLDNAVKWSPVGGEVFVGLRDGQLIVADQGPGISAADLPHVFERFYRADAAREQPGSGLGLSIVAQAAHEHGGSVSAERIPDGGTLMRLRVPRHPADGKPAEQGEPVGHLQQQDAQDRHSSTAARSSPDSGATVSSNH